MHRVRLSREIDPRELVTESPVADVRRRIAEKRAEQDKLIGQLNCWAVAKQAGYDHTEVKAFSFHHKFLTDDQRKVNRRAQQRLMCGPCDERLPYNQKAYHNCVRLHTGELVEIPLVERP